MRLGIAVLLLAWGLAAGAQQIIWKCKGPKGSLVYQNSPCAPGTALATKLYDTPDHPEARMERERDEAAMEQRNQRPHVASPGYAYSGPAQPSERDKRKGLCQAARERAQHAAFENTPDWLRVGYERTAIDACFGL